MSEYSSLKATINANVKTNDNHEITGSIMNSVLNAMVNSLGAGYQFMGVATPTNPGSAQTPDYKCFYLATTPGTYTYLGGLVVADGEVSLLKYDSSWTKEVTGIASADKLNQLGQKVETLFDPIAERTPIVGYIIGDKWRPDFVNYRSMFIDVSGRKKMHFAKGVTTGQYAFITNIPTTVEEPISYATGSSRTDVNIPGSVDVDIPNDANYVWVGILQSSDNRTPSSLIIDGYEYVDDVFTNIETKYKILNAKFNRAILGSRINGEIHTGKYLQNDGTEASNASTLYIVFPVETAKKYITYGSFLPLAWSGVVSYFVFDSSNNVLIKGPDLTSGEYNRGGYIINNLPVGAAYVAVNSHTNGMPMLYEYNAKESDLIDFGGFFPMICEEELPICDLNSVVKSQFTLLSSGAYVNKPANLGSAFLRVTTSARFILQEIIDFNGHYYVRRGTLPSTWTAWVEGAGTTINNNYDFTTIEQAVTLNASPVITTDTNNYLPSTGDTTDRTADILAMLTATGICHLGPGKFYVDKLVMPDDTTLIGCGTATIIRLVDGANRFAIKMGKRCVVSKLHITGRDNEVYPSDGNLGTRDGILWEGNYTQTSDNAQQPQMGIISDVYISFFTRGGITFSDTGYATLCMLEISNCQIWGCGAGLNITYWSEYHKFTNVKCVSCWYGCINNGGNNVFVNCDFSSCRVGMLMDNSQGQSPNNSHGSCIGCVFNHIDSNNGPSIKALSMHYGFTFTGCQIHAPIEIDDSDGFIFSGCQIGEYDITISGGKCIIFNGCIFDDQPTKTITDNTMVHFANCYTKYTGEVVTN